MDRSESRQKSGFRKIIATYTRWRVAGGGWRVASGWRVAGGGWRVASGWRLAVGGWRVAGALMNTLLHQTNGRRKKEKKQKRILLFKVTV